MRKGFSRGLDIAADRAHGLLVNFKLSGSDIQARCGKPEQRGTVRHLCLSRVLYADMYIYIYTVPHLLGVVATADIYIYIYYVYNVVCSFVHLISSLLYALELEVPADLEGPARQIRPDSWPIR